MTTDYGAAAEMFSAFLLVTLNEETVHAIGVPFSGLQDQIWSMIRLGVLVWMMYPVQSRWTLITDHLQKWCFNATMASPQAGHVGNSVDVMNAWLLHWHPFTLSILIPLSCPPWSLETVWSFFWVRCICILQLYILYVPTSGFCTIRILSTVTIHFRHEPPGFLIPTASPTVVLPPSSYTWRWPGSTTPAGGVGWAGEVFWMVWCYFCKHYKAMVEAILKNMFFGCTVYPFMVFRTYIVLFKSNGCAFRRSNDEALFGTQLENNLFRAKIRVRCLP